MISIRRSEDRGTTKLDWLDSKHTFSFGDYYDPEWEGFRSLRVINEDIIEPDNGFPFHSHRDMEIITYIIDGSLRHKDNAGGGSIIHLGEVQKMSAGTGIIHSEFNPSHSEAVHLLQIWIIPEKKGLPPGYEQKTFSHQDKEGKLLLIGSKDGRAGSVTIHQDVDLYSSYLKKGDEIHFLLLKDRAVWIQVIEGELEVNDKILLAGDSAQVSNEKEIHIKCTHPGEFLLFDLA